jgi:hypothetical protein
MNARQKAFERLGWSIPVKPLPILEWAGKNVKLFGIRGERYDPDVSPWTKDVLLDIDDPFCRISTFVKPIQSGGSSVGEIFACRIIDMATGVDLQWNWENNKKAGDRWDKRLDRILRGSVRHELWPSNIDRHKDKKCLVIFPTCNLTVQGVWEESNLDSDTITYQINEEIHSWVEGNLAKARGRTTAVWNSQAFDISNAAVKNGQLHNAYDEGTMQRWQVMCPGCRQFHVMRTKWEDNEPQLGGLRYDAKDCRMEGERYNYERLLPTIRFQMPCGYIVPNDLKIRRRLSLSGCYTLPRIGSLPKHKSRTLEAVSVDYIDWLDLIKEKHFAIRCLKNGDNNPWLKYLRERECIFCDNEDRPFFQRLVLSSNKKNRDGILDYDARFGMLDRQQGRIADGELPHWWASIYDVKEMPDGKLKTLLVFEGKLLTDEDAGEVMKSHKVPPRCVVADSGDDTVHVYKFCLQHGFNAIKGSEHSEMFVNNNTRKIYSEPKPLHAMINAAPKYEYLQDWKVTKSNSFFESRPHDDEPMFWHYSKSGVQDRHDFISSGGGGTVDYEVPGDVSEDYKLHMEAWEIQDGEYVKLKARDDLYMCACYFAMWLEIAGFIGVNSVVDV